MPDGSVIPATSSAATRRTEPEVVAGIASGEGQPAGYAFNTSPRPATQLLVTVGAAMVLGIAAGLGLGRCFGR
jgi:hypothetical protein